MTDDYISAKQAAAFDDFTINEIGVPSAVLMERAALAVYQRLLAGRVFDLKKVLVVAGSGNNGGDGIAVARMLFLRGLDVTIWLLGKRQNTSPENKRQLDIAKKYGIKTLLQVDDLSKYSTIVDAIFGVGLSRDITGGYADIIERINQTGLPVMAVDMPSGISADQGRVLNKAVIAQETVTMSYGKKGLILADGPHYAGLVTVADIGIYRTDDLQKLKNN